MIIIVVGWGAVLGAVIFYFQNLGDLISQHEIPPQELIDRWVNDGAKKTFALMFGWLYALVYSLPWLLAYAAAKKVRQFIDKTKNAEPPHSF